MSAVLEVSKSKKLRLGDFVTPKTEVVERVILSDISWETYEQLLAEHKNISNPHFAYCNGDLEIMVLGYQHETLKMRLSELIIEIARVLEIDYESSGSTTFRKEKKKKGFEGDSTYYFENAEIIRGKQEIDLAVDPPPELVIEIDITHGSLPKFPIFADLGIGEVWRFDGEDVRFYQLKNGNYEAAAESVCLPKIKSETVTELLFAAQEMKRIDWVKLIHQKIKE